MALPKPEPGLVIKYGYLWSNEALKGRDAGKDRPCAIILAAEKKDGKTIVTVAPITHAKPADMSKAVAIPPQVSRRLGLDHEQSWIITSEVNRFTWPGTDLRLVEKESTKQWAYGMLPHGLCQKVMDKILDNAKSRQVDRDVDKWLEEHEEREARRKEDKGKGEDYER